MSLKEYKPGTAFNGVIGRTFDPSEPANNAIEGGSGFVFFQ